MIIVNDRTASNQRVTCFRHDTCFERANFTLARPAIRAAAL
jgi:hypothetical protein